MATIMSSCTGVERPVFWKDGVLHLIDQQLIPTEFKIVQAADMAATIGYIKDMTVRGAPAIGAAGAYGLALFAATSKAETVEVFMKELAQAKATMDESRPTAVNLMWATARIVDALTAAAGKEGASVSSLAARVLEVAHEIAEEDVAINDAIAKHGAALVPQGANVLHHCNTGALATVDIGTALGVIYESHKQGKGIHVWVDETRPRLQGSKLTAWELMRAGVPMHLIVDSASGMLMAQGKIDVVLFGADRVAANGDVANKVGTYKMCVVARENNIPTYACVPTSTIDLEVASGRDIPIEERSATEVTHINGVQVAPEGVPVFNPAFDVTPAKYITGIITEEGVCYPPFDVSLRQAKEAAQKRIADKIKAMTA